MYLTILFLPLLASAVSGLLGRKLGSTGASTITISSLGITSVLVVIAFLEVGIAGSPVYIHIGSWIDSDLLNVGWGFSFDSLSVIMLIPILFVSTFVQIYTVDYMKEDPHNQRFFSYLTLFSFFMILLVTADNYLLMFLAWEGVGVVSFLLINFWFTRIAATKAAMLAFTQNRVGDTLLSLGLFGILWVFGNLDFASVFSLAPFINESAITIISLLLLGGASAKSAQLLLNTWLPHSMEGLLKTNYRDCNHNHYQRALHTKAGTSLSWDDIILSVPKNVLEIITGNLLGDGSLTRPNPITKSGLESKAGASFAMTLSVKGYNYMVDLYDRVYAQFGVSGLHPYPNISLPQHKDKIVTQYSFITNRTPLFTAPLKHTWYGTDETRMLILM